MAPKNPEPRMNEVLKITAFLNQEAKPDPYGGYTGQDIKHMAKMWQLDAYYNFLVGLGQPQNGHTTEEKTMAFYPKEKHTVRGKIQADFRAIQKMRALENRLRKIMAGNNGAVNYQETMILDPKHPELGYISVGYLIKRDRSFDNKIGQISLIENSDGHRVEQLEEIKSLTPKQRQINSSIVRSKSSKKRRG